MIRLADYMPKESFGHIVLVGHKVRWAYSPTIAVYILYVYMYVSIYTHCSAAPQCVVPECQTYLVSTWLARWIHRLLYYQARCSLYGIFTRGNFVIYAIH